MNSTQPFLLVGALITCTLGGPACVVSAGGCTSELRFHPITLARDTSVAFADAQVLSYEVCIRGAANCQKAAKAPGPSSAVPTITITEIAGGKARVSATVQVAEGPRRSTTELRVRGLSGDSLSFEYVADVRWKDEECHPTPEKSAI